MGVGVKTAKIFMEEKKVCIVDCQFVQSLQKTTECFSRICESQECNLLAGFKDSDEKDASIERDEKEAIHEKAVADHGNDIPEMSQQQCHNLSPITPSLEHMGYIYLYPLVYALLFLLFCC
jgi:hypothetical protein